MNESDVFARPEWYIFAMNNFIVISLPLHAVAFYCVLFKTPFHAKKYSKKLLYFMICAFITEIYLTKLMTPVILVPTETVTSYGILRSFNFPLREVTFIAVLLILMTGNSIVLVFYYRFIVMLPERNWIKRYFSENTRIAIIIFLHVICISFMLFFNYTTIPANQAKVKLEHLKRHPECVNPELFDPYALALSPFDDGETLIPFWFLAVL
ncbi:hypothetical protein WR25_14326 [Diploscapter pachys]|uniref:G-protein coupled receptors family 1 profile domain-containing protein n=1 Tax=Diploscapter pachys TaxID=2018661 RepID=A0A2A2KHA5_9BILA|nr:hypothetical protein WR25_14326 [Diploscapter pachys]